MILYGEDAVNFMKKVEEDLKKPVTLVPTPKIEKAQKLVDAYVLKIATERQDGDV